MNKRGPGVLDDLLRVAEDLARQEGREQIAGCLRSLYTRDRLEDGQRAMLWICDQVFEHAQRFAAAMKDPQPVEVAQVVVATGRWRVMVEPEQRVEGHGRFLIPFVRKNGTTFTRWMEDCPPIWEEGVIRNMRALFAGPYDPAVDPGDQNYERVLYRRMSTTPPWYEEQ